MDEPVSETTEIVGIVDGLLVIRREAVYDDGARLGGDFLVDPAQAPWIADQLEAAADERLVEVERKASPDDLVVFVRGGDRGQPINVNVHNRRAPDAPRGKTNVLGGMSPVTARKLACELRAGHW